jgi:hypothetical protein
MKRAWIVLLGFLPAFAYALVCKSVDEQGVVTYTQVLDKECPVGVALPAYQEHKNLQQTDADPAIQSVEESSQSSYQSVVISDPEPGGTVRDNEGRFTVKLELRPELQSGHFITVHIDSRNFRGRYGETKVPVNGIERGTHRIWALITDSRGREIARTEETEFTLHGAPSRFQISDYNREKQRLYGTVSGPVKALLGEDAPPDEKAFDVEIRVQTAAGEEAYTGKLYVETSAGQEAYTGRDDNVDISRTKWWVAIPEGVLINAVKILIALDESGKPENTGSLWFDKTEDVRRIFLPVVTGTYDYRDIPPADYSPPSQGISTTPGRTNPAFTPKYSP